MKTAILFDLDGTLLDTLGDLHASTNAVLRQFGYPERTIDEVRRFVGNGARVLIQQAVPEGEAHRVDEVLAAFQTYAALPPTGELDKRTWKNLALHYALAADWLENRAEL